MNLYVYWEYAEWICLYTENTRNEVNIRTKSSCSYNENTRNESVRILRIRGMNLYVYWEYAECTKSRISPRIRNKNRKYFRIFIRRLDGFVWPDHLKQKKSHASVPLKTEGLPRYSGRPFLGLPRLPFKNLFSEVYVAIPFRLVTCENQLSG